MFKWSWDTYPGHYQLVYALPTLVTNKQNTDCLDHNMCQTVYYVHIISHTMTNMFIYEHLTISPVAAQYNGACGKRSSIECVHIDRYRCWPQKSWRWRLRSTLNLDSDKFRCFNHRDEFDNTVFLPKFRLVTLLQSRVGQPLVTVMRAIYSASLALFIHGIM